MHGHALCLSVPCKCVKGFGYVSEEMGCEDRICVAITVIYVPDPRCQRQALGPSPGASGWWPLLVSSQLKLPFDFRAASATHKFLFLSSGPKGRLIALFCARSFIESGTLPGARA